ncbi:MAG: type VI secretion system Vgr family protein [Duganella sp.]
MITPSDLPGASFVDSVFGTGLSQNARLITLASAQDSTLPQALMPEHFSGREAVNELFRFDIDALSTSTDLELADFIGEEITLKLLQADGTRRAWHGICTDAAWLGADGGMARYRLRLEPGLALLGLRRDSYIFQDKNAQDLITELLADYLQVRFEFDVTQTLAVRPIWTQYRESDLEFLQRVLAAEGLSFRFEHEQDGEQDSGAPAGSQQQAKHKVVFFDSKAVAPDTLGGSALRFHGVRATDTDDAIDEFNAQRRVQANAVTISSWDPGQLVAPSAEQSTSLDIGELPSLSIYDGSAERRHADNSAADPHSRLMLQALELDNKLFEGQGAVRRLAAGHGFTLTQHEHYLEGDNAFTVLWVEHEARNNISPAMDGIGKLLGAAKAGLATLAQFAGSALENGTYRNRFACVRNTVAIVPRASAARFAGSALGPQTALVVGLPDAVNTTTREHQVRIQFAWQRGASSNAGGLAHNTDQAGNAPGNDASGTWVRVAEALAGPNWGSQFTPRIGTEVLVDFIEGDMDRPLVVAQLYTGADAPPYAAGIDSGVNHAGVISGIHSNNFDGGGYNQWVVDDTPGQLRTRLATSSAATQLNLGYLVQQAPGSAQRGSYRGYGFELRTDAWSMVRSGEGLLISATARPLQGAGVASTQLDSAEAVGMLKSAAELNKVLADAATQHSALSSKPAGEAQVDFIAQIDPSQKGKFEGSVGGHEALKASEGKREPDPAAPVEKFAQPVVLMEAPASINWATPASTVLFAGGQMQWTTQADMHMAAAFTMTSVSASATGLFTHAGGIQAIAANGPVSLQAHTDQLEILADKAITVISVNDVIEVKASQKIVLQAGQSSVTLEGGNITFACPGNFTVKSGQHLFTGGASNSPDFPVLPDTKVKFYDEAFILKDPTGMPLSDIPYKIKGPSGEVISRTTENGLSERVATEASESIEFSMEWFKVVPFKK